MYGRIRSGTRTAASHWNPVCKGVYAPSPLIGAGHRLLEPLPADRARVLRACSGKIRWSQWTRSTARPSHACQIPHRMTTRNDPLKAWFRRDRAGQRGGSNTRKIGESGRNPARSTYVDVSLSGHRDRQHAPRNRVRESPCLLCNVNAAQNKRDPGHGVRSVHLHLSTLWLTAGWDGSQRKPC